MGQSLTCGLSPISAQAGNFPEHFRRLVRSHGGEPRKIVTGKLRSYGVAHRELIPETIHSNMQLLRVNLPETTDLREKLTLQQRLPVDITS